MFRLWARHVLPAVWAAWNMALAQRKAAEETRSRRAQLFIRGRRASRALREYTAEQVAESAVLEAAVPRLELASTRRLFVSWQQAARLQILGHAVSHQHVVLESQVALRDSFDIWVARAAARALLRRVFADAASCYAYTISHPPALRLALFAAEVFDAWREQSLISSAHGRRVVARHAEAHFGSLRLQRNALAVWRGATAERCVQRQLQRSLLARKVFVTLTAWRLAAAERTLFRERVSARSGIAQVDLAFSHWVLATAASKQRTYACAARCLSRWRQVANVSQHVAPTVFSTQRLLRSSLASWRVETTISCSARAVRALHRTAVQLSVLSEWRAAAASRRHEQLIFRLADGFRAHCVQRTAFEVLIDTATAFRHLRQREAAVANVSELHCMGLAFASWRHQALLPRVRYAEEAAAVILFLHRLVAAGSGYAEPPCSFDFLAYIPPSSQLAELRRFLSSLGRAVAGGQALINASKGPTLSCTVILAPGSVAHTAPQLATLARSLARLEAAAAKSIFRAWRAATSERIAGRQARSRVLLSLAPNVFPVPPPDSAVPHAARGHYASHVLSLSRAGTRVSGTLPLSVSRHRPAPPLTAPSKPALPSRGGVRPAVSSSSKLGFSASFDGRLLV
jgi:hypothetical protein